MKTNPNLIESLDVGGRPVVSDGEDFGVSKLHAKSGSHLGQTPDEILGYLTIPSKNNLIIARDFPTIIIIYLGLWMTTHLLQDITDTWLHFLKALPQSALSTWYLALLLPLPRISSGSRILLRN